MTDELLSVLEKHARQYPGLQVRDAAKLLYQNELGPGHMIKSANDSLRRLEAELPGAPAVPFLFEDIGNGLCRLHLGGLKEREIAPATVNRFFIFTANTHQGSIAGLEEKLAVLAGACRKGDLPLPVGEVEAFIRDWSRQGYPPVSHSPEYRRLYAPAYRVVKAVFRDYFPLFDRIDALLKAGGAVNVAIDGMSGSGKSSLAALLQQIYDCNVFHMDDFFLPQAMKTPRRLSQPGGNVHHERFRREVLASLSTGRPFCYRPFDCRSQSLGDAVCIEPKQLNIVEGAYCLHPALADAYQLRVFMQVGPETQRARILQRNGPAMYQRFLEEWVPLENMYFQAYKIKDQCDLVF